MEKNANMHDPLHNVNQWEALYYRQCMEINYSRIIPSSPGTDRRSLMQVNCLLVVKSTDYKIFWHAVFTSVKHERNKQLTVFLDMSQLPGSIASAFHLANDAKITLSVPHIYFGLLFSISKTTHCKRQKTNLR